MGLGSCKQPPVFLLSFTVPVGSQTAALCRAYYNDMIPGNINIA